jgi:hypothetical protein
MKNSLLFVCFLIANTAISQEVLTTLINNPILMQNKVAMKQHKSALALPFIDDFSYPSTQPDNTLWSFSSVFVNRTYPINPPTIGVATFDGLNANGLAYAIDISIPQGEADTLLSQEIDLSSVGTAFLLFYYQPQGLGDNPQTEDSLILEFKDVNNNWHVQWKKHGGYSHEFKKRAFIINTSNYLTNNFQFRFRNKATLSGNFDHWHIDYVKVDQFNNSSDTTSLEDVSFVFNSPSFLSRYNEMPWTHFLNNELSEMLDTVDVLIRNNDASISVEYQYNVYSNGSQIAHYPSLGVWRNESIFDYDSIIGNFSFSNPPISVSSSVFNSIIPDSASFTIEHIIKTGANDYKLNDTLYRIQNFFSHFAYDDGIAESAYGINVNGAKLAYQFKLNRPDTLRAIQMYFPQMLDTVNHIPFKLTIWDNINGSGSIIHQQEVYPVHTENGDFHTYHLDSLFQLVGTFYIGWEQTTNDLLNIGLDKNLHANQYMYYNVGAGWTNSQFPGSWMIRPVVSQKTLPTSINEASPSFSIYPNPAHSQLYIKTNDNSNRLTMYNMQGVIVKQVHLQNTLTSISIADLSPALYIIKVETKKGSSHQKLLIK